MDKQLIDNLIIQTAAGDMDSFEKLYGQMRKPVFAYACTILKNKERAEDILQDTFILIFQKARQYKGANSTAWVYSITRNLCYDSFKKDRREIAVDEFYEDDQPDGGLEIENEIVDSILINSALRCLDMIDRQIVFLYAVEGFKHREIAGVLGIPLGTILWRYRRALKKLKNIILESDIKHEK